MHTPGSKIVTFFFLFSLLITTSCRKYEDVIPDTCVSFEIDLVYDPLFYDLSAGGGNSVIVTSATNNWGVCAAGYDNNGIIVYNSGDGYFAYDRTCPYCYKVGGTSVAVKIDGVDAVCPLCGTIYLLPSYGTPTSAGPGQYMLKNYRTRFSGYYIRVWNPDY
jgi:hypothetical protein